MGVFLVSLLIPMLAAAADRHPVQNLCVGTDQILDHTQVCHDNELFVSYARRCLDSFRGAVSVTSKAMRPGLSRDSGVRQLQKFGDTVSDYGLTIDKLQELIAVNQRAEKELNLYLANLVKPFDVRNLMDVPCFGDSVDKIRDTIGYLRDDRMDLQDALAAARNNFKSATASGDHLNVDGNAKRVRSSKGQGGVAAPSIPQGDSPNAVSDISGTKEAKERDKKLPVTPAGP